MLKAVSASIYFNITFARSCGCLSRYSPRILLLGLLFPYPLICLIRWPSGPYVGRIQKLRQKYTKNINQIFTDDTFDVYLSCNIYWIMMAFWRCYINYQYYNKVLFFILPFSIVLFCISIHFLFTWWSALQKKYCIYYYYYYYRYCLY